MAVGTKHIKLYLDDYEWAWEWRRPGESFPKMFHRLRKQVEDQSASTQKVQERQK